MKHLNYLTSKEKRAIWLRAFHMWQRRPYEVAPLKNETHTCASCKTVFTGNYCPRCGQAAEVGRFSFKKTVMMFLDLWAIGNRSMLRTIRDLILRPGYMIRDYISGMRSAYFPPFQMFCLLATFSLIVEQGIDLGLSDEKKAVPTEQTTAPSTESLKEGLDQAEDATTLIVESQKEDRARDGKSFFQNREKVKASPVVHAIDRTIKVLDKLRDMNPSVFSLLTLMLFSLPLYLFLRHSPKIPDLRFSEFAVALVYTSNAYSIFSIIGNLLGSFIIQLLAILMIFVTLKQFTGYSKKRLLGYSTLSLLIVSTILIVLCSLVIYVLYVTTK